MSKRTASELDDAISVPKDGFVTRDMIINNKENAPPIGLNNKRVEKEVNRVNKTPPIDSVNIDRDSDDDRLRYIDANCDQVRKKIDAFINSGEMKVGEFQRAIGVSSHSYLSFLGQKGPMAGSNSATYDTAWRFFKKRELRGIKLPRPNAKRAKLSKEDRDAAAAKYDVSMIRLHGEEDSSVPVYDTCDTMRSKIRAHLRRPEVTQASSVRDLLRMYPDGESPRGLTAASVPGFLRKRGPCKGAGMELFYDAYVFFEKLRIKENKPKSSFREDMEFLWPGGFELMDPVNRGYIVRAGRDLYMDEYGRVRSY